jgi:hypothetical protein
MRIYKTLTILATGVALAACNEALVPDFNVPTGFPHSVAALQSEFTGTFNGIRFDLAAYQLEMDGFARNSAYYTPSEERFVTQLTGQTPLDDDNFGSRDWAFEYETIKEADSVIGVLPTLTNNGLAIPAANIKALVGSMETTKALNYMYVLLSHDTVGIAISNPGGPITGNIAPIVCARDSWKDIIAILDTAQADFVAAGPSTILGVPNSVFPTLQVPPGYAAIGTTAGGWMNLVLALRGRARVEYAYAIAQGPGGTRPDSASPGGPDANQLDSAIIDIQASSLYSSSLSPGEAVNFNDIGVFHSFSSAAGDVVNPIFPNSAAIFVMEGAARQIDTTNDLRFLAKFAIAPSLPTSNGSNSASSYAYFNNIGLSTPMPIIRNLELQFLLARAYLGTGQLVKAAQTVDAVRTQVGGLPSALTGPYSLIHVDSVKTINGTKTLFTDTVTYTVNQSSYTSVRDFLIREMIPTLMDDGTGDQIAAIRDYGLILQDLTTWEHIPGNNGVDLHTSQENIPVAERQQRNNSFAPVCS